MSEKPTVIICVPGRVFTNRFFISWSECLIKLFYKYNVNVSNEYSSQVNFARAKCLRAHALAGPDQKPFQGQIDYDVILWLDSDMVFHYELIDELIQNCLYKYPVVSGIYSIDGGNHLSCVKDWNMDYYIKHGHFDFLTEEGAVELIDSGNEWIKCGYSGMGCMAIRKGVFENERLKYPWFFSDVKQLYTGNQSMPYIMEGFSEDVSFIRKMIDGGIIDGVMVNLKLRFGHEKSIVY